MSPLILPAHLFPALFIFPCGSDLSGKYYALFISVFQQCLAWYQGPSKNSVYVCGIELRCKHLHYTFISRAQWAFSISWRCRLYFLVLSLQKRGEPHCSKCSPTPNTRSFSCCLVSWGPWPAQLRAHLHLQQIRKPVFSLQLARGTIFPFQFELHISTSSYHWMFKDNLTLPLFVLAFQI